MKVKATVLLALTVLFSATTRHPDHNVPNVIEEPHVSSKITAECTLTIPVLAIVTLPGLSESLINTPLVVPGVNSGLQPTWQVYMRLVPVQTKAAQIGHKFFSPVYVGSMVLIMITFALFALIIVQALLTCVWILCSRLVVNFSEPSSPNSSNYTATTKR